MTIRNYTVHIDASQEAVYDYVSDVMRHPEWAHEKLEMERLSGLDSEPGASFAYVVHFLGTTRGRLTVLEAQRPTRFAYECDDPSGLYRWTFDLAPEDSGTRLTHHLEFVRTSLMIKLAKPIMLPLVGNRMVTGGLENIKASLEAPVGAKA